MNCNSCENTLDLSATIRFVFPDCSCGQNEVPHDEFDSVVLDPRLEKAREDAKFPHTSAEKNN